MNWRGVIETDLWLEADFKNPFKICERIIRSEEVEEFYQYLIRFGMYKPNSRTFIYFQQLREKKIWDHVTELHHKYQRKWKGPDVDIYIFPINTSVFSRYQQKSGVSFEDKMFLFLTPLDDLKDLEALFVHEYHHICRMRKQNKKVKEFTLLDSMILEGLAEYMVEKCCGKEYRSKWCTYYTRQEILEYWDKRIKHQIHQLKNSKVHDEILFGKNRFPPLIGYAVGFEMVQRHQGSISLIDTFRLPAKYFIRDLKETKNEVGQD